MNANTDARKLLESINKIFKRMPKNTYVLCVANQTYDGVFNFFIESQKQDEPTHSTPIYSINNYDLAYLEAVMNIVDAENKLTRKYIGFDGMSWPKSKNKIK